MRLYLDAAPAIYTIEQVTPYAAVVDAKLSPGGIVKVASYLTRMECRYQTHAGRQSGSAEGLRRLFRERRGRDCCAVK